jgi:hypothetical protein
MSRDEGRTFFAARCSCIFCLTESLHGFSLELDRLRSESRRRRLDGLLEGVGPVDLHLPLEDLVSAGGIEDIVSDEAEE